VRWTDEIEQVVNYHKRGKTPKPKSVKLKKMAWLLIGAVVIIIAGIVLYANDVFK
jgi:hypothetical protein